jgi:nicotinate-nucleotide--dimethylbenzimidazole phosphoribosyltransferase
MAGAILAARLQRVPVVLDGMAALAAAAVLRAVDGSALAGCCVGHLPAVAGAGRLIEDLGMRPALLDLHMARNGGVGAALSAGLVRTAVLARAPARLKAPVPAPA